MRRRTEQRVDLSSWKGSFLGGETLQICCAKRVQKNPGQEGRNFAQEYCQPQSTYICRVQSCVWLLPKYWPPTPSPPSECVLPPNPKTGGHTLAGRWGGGGSIFWKTPDIGLASYSIISLRCQHLKGQCHEIFCFWFFSWISFPPAPEYCIRTVLNFFENSRR